MVGLVSRGFSGSGVPALAGVPGRGTQIVSFEGEEFRVSSLRTGVSGVVASLLRGVTRCVGIADASLSLSLSLWSWGLLTGSRFSRSAGRLWRAASGALAASRLGVWALANVRLLATVAMPWGAV
jgi:hypothetical protein